MNAHALGILEFPRVLAMVAGRASSSLGAARIRALAPVDDRAWIETELARVAAVRALVASEVGFSMEAIPEIGVALDRLRIVDSSLSGAEHLGLHRLLRSS